MQNYEIVIREMLQKGITVNAGSLKEAMRIARRDYKEGRIQLDMDDRIGHSITTLVDGYAESVEQENAENAIEFINTHSMQLENADDQLGWESVKQICLSALRRDIPFKPKEKEYEPTLCLCGCWLSKDLGDGYYRIERNPYRCEVCGQLLDWS